MRGVDNRLGLGADLLTTDTWLCCSAADCLYLHQRLRHGAPSLRPGQLSSMRCGCQLQCVLPLASLQLLLSHLKLVSLLT